MAKSSSRTKGKPKQTRKNFAVATRNIREVNWERDAPVAVPVQVKDRLAALSMEHSSIRKELDVLRLTRGKRDVGVLKVPAHLQDGMTLDDRDRDPRTGKVIRTERRAELANVLPSED